jgi:hypothetical protein
MNSDVVMFLTICCWVCFSYLQTKFCLILKFYMLIEHHLIMIAEVILVTVTSISDEFARHLHMMYYIFTLHSKHNFDYYFVL